MQRKAARRGDDKHILKSDFDIHEEIKALKTSSGIRNWHLMVPNWGCGEISQKQKRREEMKLEREIQKWAREENEKISQQMQKKREWEQFKMDYATQGLKQRDQNDVDEILNDSILEGMKKKKRKKNHLATNHHQEQEDDQEEGLEDGKEQQRYVDVAPNVSEGYRSDATMEILADSFEKTSQFLCCLSGDIIVQQETNVQRRASHSSLQTIIMIQSKSQFASAVILLPSSSPDQDNHENMEEMKKDSQTLYYEVEIETGGIAQIGWAWTKNIVDIKNHGFSPNSDSGDGVGDDAFSYGFDGLRGKIFHNGKDTDYGPSKAAPWKRGDVVGCLYDKMNGIISFSVNGNDYGKAFEVSDEFKGHWLCPVVSFNENEVIGINIGPYFCHAPKDHIAVSCLISQDASKQGMDSDLEQKGENSMPMEEKEEEEENYGKKIKHVDLTGIPLPFPLHPPSRAYSENDNTKSNIKSTEKYGHGVDDGHACIDESQEDFNLEHYNSAKELESLGMEKLKRELFRLGCKCGGSLEERAKRLFSIKGLARDQIPIKLRGKNFDHQQI
jgi:hypothetical protein